MWSGKTTYRPTAQKSACCHASRRQLTASWFAKMGFLSLVQTVRNTRIDRFPTSLTGKWIGDLRVGFESMSPREVHSWQRRFLDSSESTRKRNAGPDGAGPSRRDDRRVVPEMQRFQVTPGPDGAGSSGGTTAVSSWRWRGSKRFLYRTAPVPPEGRPPCRPSGQTVPVLRRLLGGMAYGLRIDRSAIRST